VTQNLRSLFQSFFRVSYTGLLFALLGAFALFPLLGEAPWARLVLSITLMLMMASALFAIQSHRRVFVMGLGLAVANAAAMVLAYVFAVEWAEPVNTGLSFLFLILLTVVIFSDVMRAEVVDLNTVFGACCVYLMLGMIWSGVYELIEYFQPGSFTLGGAQRGTVSRADSSSSELFYYSFITMTTVGYGDVTPVSAAARAFAALHGLVGQLYIAIVVARLVGLEVANRMQGGTPNGK
jgi:hypothetical protein